MAWLIILATLLTPLLLGLIFKTQSSHIFFGIMAGELLARYIIQQNDNTVRSNEFRIIIIYLTAIITAIIARNSTGKLKLVLNTIPLLFTGVILGAFTFELLPKDLSELIHANTFGKFIATNNTWIIIGTVMLQMASLWYTNRVSKHHQSREEQD